MIFTLTGCSDDGKPTEAAEGFLDAFKADDSEALADYYAGRQVINLEAFQPTKTPLDANEKKELMDIIRSFSYKVEKESIDENKGIVKVEISTCEFFTVAESTYDEITDLQLEGTVDKNNLIEEYLNRYWANLKDSKKTFVSTIDLKLTKKDGKWYVDDISNDSDFSNAILDDLMKINEFI